MIDWKSAIENGDTVHIRFTYTHTPSGKRCWEIGKLRMKDGKAELFNLLVDANGIGDEAFTLFAECELDEAAEWLVTKTLNGEDVFSTDLIKEKGSTLAFEMAYDYTCEATLYVNFQGDAKAKELYEFQREWHDAMREVCKKGA